MWIFPKSQVGDFTESCVLGLSEMCAKSLTVRSKQLSTRRWMLKLTRNEHPFLLGRIHTQCREASHKALLSTSPSRKSYNAHLSNMWQDLPLFATATPFEQAFCQISVAMYDDWVAKQRRAHSLRLNAHTDFWPTPTMQEFPHYEMVLTPTQRRKPRSGTSHSLNLWDSARTFANGFGTNDELQLNPRWVEGVMGLPIGWVRPSTLFLLQIGK